MRCRPLLRLNDKRLGEMGLSRDLTKRFLDHTRLVLFGITSILPASWGTQKLWITSVDSSVMKVGVGLAASLTLRAGEASVQLAPAAGGAAATAQLRKR